MATKRFVTLLTCIDGRTIEPFVRYMKERHNADYVDVITEPGMCRILSENSWEADQKIKEIKEKVRISAMGHGSGIVAIAAHPDCLGNPVANEAQVQQLLKARRTVAEFRFGGINPLLWLEEDFATVREITSPATAVA